MEPTSRTKLGRTNIELTRLGFGGGSLGDGAASIPDTQADETVVAALEAGLTFFDTSPWYGLGLNEHRMGRVLRREPRGEFVLSTKVGRVLRRPADPDRFVPGTFTPSAPPSSCPPRTAAWRK